MKKLSGSLVVLLWAVFMLLATDALAILKDFGPTDPANGYPVWYRDLSTNVSANGQDFPQGLPLELCDSMTQNGNGYLCNLLPEDPAPPASPGYDPAQPRDFATNFPHESFYFLADAAIAGGGDFANAGLGLALEAAFGGDVAPGNQITFARVRIRIDINTPGNYRITHPYGVLNFPNVPAGGRAINFTEDIGIGNPGDFSGALAGAIGPFLTWDTDFPIVIGEDVFIGDPAVAHTVTGSPFGTNVFRIERIDAEGNTLTQEETSLFNLTGKIFTTPISSPLKATRASYVRNAAGAHVFVFAEADVVSNSPPSLSSLQVSAPGVDPTLMSTDGNGNFFAHLSTAADTLPATVTITNIADNPPNAIEVAVIDEVTIDSAVYNSDNQTLTLSASSSDSVAVPELTTPYGNMVDGKQFVTDLLALPPKITVLSSAKGQDTEQIQITSADLATGQVVTPNGGEVFYGASEAVVRWANFPGDAASFNLFYFDADLTPHFIATVGNVSSYNWQVPRVLAEEDGKRFRVTAFDAIGNRLGVAWSDAPFTITPNPAVVRMITPNGSEVLTSGEISTVEWNPALGATYYNLFYFDADQTPHFVATVGNVTSYNWQVPAVTEGSGKRFRVTAFDAADNRLGVDWSDAAFSIQPPLVQ